MLRAFPPTGFNAYHRSQTRPAPLAARCASRTAEHRKNPAKPSKLGFAGFFLCSGCPGTRLAPLLSWRKQVCFSIQVVRPLGVQRARSARKMIQWIIFSEGGPEGPGPEGPLAQGSKRPEKHPLGWFSAESGPEGPGLGCGSPTSLSPVKFQFVYFLTDKINPFLISFSCCFYLGGVYCLP